VGAQRSQRTRRDSRLRRPLRGLYRTLAQSQAVPVRWSGELLDRIEAERCRRLPRANLAERQEWRDRRLIALANHIAETDTISAASHIDHGCGRRERGLA
jgi:hypothetical protein